MCVVVTPAMNLWGHYRDEFDFLRSNGFEVTAIADRGEEHQLLRRRGFRTVVIPMKRRAAPLRDLIALLRMTAFFTFNRFDVVCVSTPKASLLGALAAFLTRQKRLIFLVRGRAYENMRGPARCFYQSLDKLICSLSDLVLSISREMMDDFVRNGICPQSRISLIASGSSSGVDLRRFTGSPALTEAGREIRAQLGIPDGAIMILYSGRIRAEKGINQLVAAFENVVVVRPDTHLMIQGRFELEDPLTTQTVEAIERHPHIHLAGWCNDVERYFAAADIFAFPSYREGFGNVAIEAAAMELPVVAFSVAGVRESVLDGVTGILCQTIGPEPLKRALLELIDNPQLRIQYAAAGRARAVAEFDSRIVWRDLLEHYRSQAQYGRGPVRALRRKRLRTVIPARER